MKTKLGCGVTLTSSGLSQALVEQTNKLIIDRGGKGLIRHLIGWTRHRSLSSVPITFGPDNISADQSECSNLTIQCRKSPTRNYFTNGYWFSPVCNVVLTILVTWFRTLVKASATDHLITTHCDTETSRNTWVVIG